MNGSHELVVSCQLLVGAKHLEDKLSICQLSVVSCQLSVGAKHLEDKLSVIAKNSSPNAKHLEDKLSIIAKNSSPNASPVQLLGDKNFR
ncbi:MAG: hypothetical protein AN482_12455 [Anabaena sp. LE011-02]|nr:MAG: hypothetical protein AN482_12455 [Anabaena sp. LE011-02]